MFFLYSAYARSYQWILRVLARFVSYPEHRLIEGEGSSLRLVDELSSRGYVRPLFVLSDSVHHSGADAPLLDGLKEKGIEPTLYVLPSGEPGFDTANACYLEMKRANCDAIVAIGGGSAMDVAKSAGVIFAYKGKDIASFRGLLKVHRKLPFMAFVPTTAGTGSEITPVAVLSLPHGEGKVAIMSPRLTPSLAVLDPVYLKSLPERPAVYGILDALTHALESFLNRPKDSQVARDAIAATRTILEKGRLFAQNRNDLSLNLEMLKASYLAGRAFARGYVGYSHALSHAIGGRYHLPHGYLNAVLLPYVLRAYGSKAYPALARLEEAIGGSNDLSMAKKAEAFIARVNSLERDLHIDQKLPLPSFGEEAASSLAHEAAKEANPLYHVPKILSEEELALILKSAVTSV